MSIVLLLAARPPRRLFDRRRLHGCFDRPLAAGHCEPQGDRRSASFGFSSNVNLKHSRVGSPGAGAAETRHRSGDSTKRSRGFSPLARRAQAPAVDTVGGNIAEITRRDTARRGGEGRLDRAGVRGGRGGQSQSQARLRRQADLFAHRVIGVNRQRRQASPDRDARSASGKMTPRS